ncbi:MAG: FAD:protein FMN transferase [Proteobacteria bacterium]|nr:FAD:protein FMN transferase [Pseudomonadota bacterium]
MTHEDPPGPAGPGERPAGGGEGGATLRRLRPALGTWVAIEASGGSAAGALQAVEAAYGCIRSVEQCMHPQRAGSDLARVREAAAGTCVRIDRATWEVLAFAHRLFALSQGIFDPCLPEGRGRLCDLELSAAGEEPWARPRASLHIDCGGIAKGYAVDRALQALRAAGCSAGVVNAGGDLRVYGPQPQTLLLRRADGSYLPCELCDAALAVSDLDATNRPPEHRGYYARHPASRTGRRYAAVRAGEAMVADALTKCVLLCEAPLAEAVVQALSAQILA